MVIVPEEMLTMRSASLGLPIASMSQRLLTMLVLPGPKWMMPPVLSIWVETMFTSPPHQLMKPDIWVR